MMGCMPTPATSSPFHAPHSAAVPSAAARASAIGTRVIGTVWPLTMSSWSPISSTATAPAMATTAPTEMSMPRVAMTRVMPSATIASGAARLTMSTRLP